MKRDAWISARSLVALAAFLGTHSPLAAAQMTVRVSVNSTGAQGNGHSGSYRPSISPDGRYVAFDASNLIAGTNGFRHVYVRDRQSGTTERVSIDSSGVEGDFDSFDTAISADARFVVFESFASNLVPGDTNGERDIFVRDRSIGTTQRVSVSSTGAQANDHSEHPSISADGRYVAFECFAANLVLVDTNGSRDIFVRDLSTGTTELVSVDSAGAQGNGDCDSPSISADGRLVAFTSRAGNLVPGDTGGLLDIFVHDRLSGTTERVSLDSGGTQGNFNSYNASISADGRYVAFHSHATNLVSGDTNGTIDVFVRDRQSGTTERVNVSSGGVQANSQSQDPSISADGRYVSFSSYASNLVVGDTNGYLDAFVRDRQSGTTERASVAADGTQGDFSSEASSISADGRCVAFPSYSTNLVTGDTNDKRDIFVREHLDSPAFTSFCSGDGSGTACPCGNAGLAGNGCASSVNANGANLAASGTPSVGSDTMVLSGSGMPDSSALYFQGTTQAGGGLGTVFGDGLRCASGSVIRLGTNVNAGGASQYPQGGDSSISVKGANAAGNVRTYQCWYRNAAAFCTTATFNLTNGMQATWVP